MRDGNKNSGGYGEGGCEDRRFHKWSGIDKGGHDLNDANDPLYANGSFQLAER